MKSISNQLTVGGVSMVAMGEGWHNYHHTFPWDYKAAEHAYHLNTTTLILDLFAKIGWAYDTKEASPKLIQDVSQKRGEHHFIDKNINGN
ncbi:Acyl-CoA desaturase [Eumeta japonica]|uniref:Acyl-CoA desaturase n=1 Tax=Eumeta variegata TaxID=151549 RepID=A0A4C1U9G0_EUMVA|nr:Acyl-CoA desaturase [Eumeta japonica]